MRPSGIFLCVLIAGCAGPPAPRRDVILITLDTTRADGIGVYGCPDVRTPLLDSWARTGAIVEHAFADVPLTLPSHVTMFTGTPSLYHGVRTNGDARLGEAAPTLAERFGELGFRTEAVVSSRVLEAATGIAQGFDAFDDSLTSPYEVQDESVFPRERHWLPAVDRRADEAVARATAAVGRLAGGGSRFFLWLHLYDAHFPYDAPPPWNRTQADRYLAEIECMDYELRRFAREIPESAAVVVTADHGEGLDDHGEDEHGILLYDETVRVPLLLRGPLVPAGTVLSEVVRTVDVAPTLLHLAGAPPAFGAGGSLVPVLRGEGPIPGTVAYCETVQPRLWGGSPVKALRTRDRKLVWAPRPELYDVVADPGETRDLAAEREGEVEELADELEDLVLQTIGIRSGWAEPVAPDDERMEALRALGYAAGGGPAGAPAATPPVARTAPEELRREGFDPKDLVDVAMAGRDFENGFHDNARRKLERFLRTVEPPETRPELRPLWSLARQNLGGIALRAGRFDEAAAQLREALRHEPGNEAAQWELVMALNLAGRPAEAEREASRMADASPPAWKVRLQRGLALALHGRPAEAKAELGAVADGAADPETRRVAAMFRDAVGTAEERAALDAYLRSWSAG
ncbi:MAG: sulfatase-like hydrolase/transferase [Candidatus Eiseniibacteriota bacterium]